MNDITVAMSIIYVQPMLQKSYQSHQLLLQNRKC